MAECPTPLIKDLTAIHWQTSTSLSYKKLALLILLGRYDDNPSRLKLDVADELFKIWLEFEPARTVERIFPCKPCPLKFK